ncbi:hypothetical protein UA34_21270, partial [Photobacterium angustum]
GIPPRQHQYLHSKWLLATSLVMLLHYQVGLSPRVRGTPDAVDGEDVPNRFIPEGAGNTLNTIY